MSSVGVGAVSVVPLAAIGGAAIVGGAVILAAGVGVCILGARAATEGGKAVVAGTQAVHRACEEHAAKRRAWNRATRSAQRGTITARTKPEVILQNYNQIKLLRQEEQEFIDRLEQIAGQQELAAVAPIELQPLPDPLSAGMLNPGDVRYVTAYDNVERKERLDSWRISAQNALKRYQAAGIWQELFNVSQLEDLLAASSANLDADEFSAAESNLRTAHHIIHQFNEQAPKKWRDRYRLSQTFSDISEVLAEIESIFTAHPELAEPAADIWKRVTEAKAAAENYEFAQALIIAQSALKWGQQVMLMPANWRREALRHEYLALEEETASYDEARSEAFQTLLSRIGRIVDNPESSSEDLQRAEGMLDQAGQIADEWLKAVEQTSTGNLVRSNLTYLATQQLQEMGYTVTAETPGQETVPWRLTGKRNGHSFMVEIGHDGTLWYDVTKGFKGHECGDEIQRFLRGLEEQGVKGYWEPVYSSEYSLELLRKALNDLGFVTVVEEANEDGTVVIDALRPEGHSQPVATVFSNGDIDYTSAEEGGVLSLEQQDQTATQVREELIISARTIQQPERIRVHHD